MAKEHKLQAAVVVTTTIQAAVVVEIVLQAAQEVTKMLLVLLDAVEIIQELEARSSLPMKPDFF